MKPKLLLFPILASALISPVIAADFIWKGTTDTSWTEGTNWLGGTAPAYGATLTADRLVIGNGEDFEAIYNPGAGVTTTFGSGRGIIIGSSTNGPANLTISSGILKINGTGSDNPIMANGVNATLTLNGGDIDLTGHPVGFRLCGLGAADRTSDLNITNGTFSSGVFDFFSNGTEGTSTVNLNTGGVLAVSRFIKTATDATSILNLDGGTLRLRNTQSSPNVYFANLPGLQTIVNDGGVIVDTNTFNANIAEVLEHDTSLGETPDGGLTKNGAGTLTISASNTFTGPVTINAGTALTTPSRLLLNNDTGAGTGAITFAGSFTDIQVNNTRIVANPVTLSNTGDEKNILLPSPGGGAFAGATFSGPITIDETNPDHFRVRADDNCFLTFSGKVSGSGGIFKFQPGRLTLTNSSNDFTGDIKITHGSVSFTNGALGSTGAIRMEGGPTINTATLRWDPTNDQDISSRLVMFDAKTAILLMADGGEPYDSSNVIFANAIGNSSSAKLQKTGNGTLALTQPSTYTGGTTITQGTLEFANDALGTTGAVTMDGGILRWATGNTQDVSARITMVDAKTASFSTNGNNVTLSNAIGNASTGNFSKTNTPGTLTLTSIATYTGTTAIGGGTLALGANNIIPDSSNVSIGTATLDAATFDDQLGTLDVTAAATINLGTGANLLFADSNLVDWTGGTLNITGTFVSGSSIKFATTGGLTSTQLALITLNGAPAIFTLDASGFLTAAPVAGFAAWQSANSTASGIDADHDNDGLSNGIEWFLGGTSDTTGFNPLPGVTDAAGTLTVTWTKAATFTGTYGTNFVVETSPNLATTWTPVTEGVGADKVEITGNSVKYTFPAGTTNFARLKVITTP